MFDGSDGNIWKKKLFFRIGQILDGNLIYRGGVWTINLKVCFQSRKQHKIDFKWNDWIPDKEMNVLLKFKYV